MKPLLAVVLIFLFACRSGAQRSFMDTIIHYEDLAYAYVETGDFKKAENTMNEALDLCESQPGITDREYAYALSVLAWINFVQGKYAEALGHYAAASKYSRLSEDYAGIKTSLENMAKMYLLLAQYDNAETLLTGIQQTIYDIEPQLKNTPEYIMHLHTWAKLYENQNENLQADSIYFEMINLLVSGQIKEAGMCFPVVLGDVANFLYKKKRYKEAAFSYDILYQGRMEEDNLRYVSVNDFLSLARYFYCEKDYRKAEELILKINGYYVSLMKNNALFLPETERYEFWKSIEKNYNLFYAVTREISSPQLASLCYDNCLKLKSILLTTSRQIREFIYNSKNESLINSYEELLRINHTILLSKNINESNSYYLSGMNALEKKRKEIEDRLTREVPLYATSKDQLSVSWQDIKAKLKKDEAAIEFITFEENDSTRYGMALLVGADSKYPQIIKLYEQKQLSFLNSTSNIEHLYHDIRLYNFIWQPLTKYLQGISKIYFSVSGSLNTVSFHAIPLGRRFLSQEFDLHQVSSTASLVTGNLNESVNTTDAVVYGDMDYGSQCGWENFEYGKQEVDNIFHQLKMLKIETKVLTKEHATKKSMMDLHKKAPANLFISTHGFYDTSFNKNDESSLQRTGLIFSINPDTQKCDTLFAKEIADLNLSGLDLVILSACKTGLGDIDDNEGVFGLQRAFKLAGAKTIIMTLWEVPTEESAIFMRNFFEQLHQSKIKTKHEVFREAQRLIRRSDNVEEWAGFIMID